MHDHMTNISNAGRAATSALAGIGIFIEAWLPSLDQMSNMAGAWVPILSAVWLAVQIVRAVWPKPKPKKE